MSCPQDPDLLKLGVAVDKFQVGVQAYMLTHAHMDHMKGLKADFGDKRDQAKIFATRVTADLAKLAVSGLREEDFQIIQYDTPFYPAEHVTAWAFPAYHCDGSCMFLFELNGDSDDPQRLLRILYTGDFRFHPDMRKNQMLIDFMIDRLYYDDVFDEIDDEYPNYAESLNHMMAGIAMLEDRGYKRIYINASILGLEPILREIADVTGRPFGLSPALRGTWRGRQLKYLLGDRLDETHTAHLTLAHRKHDDDHRIPWIIPTCTYFLCDDKHKQKKPLHHFYVWFCTHSNQLENNHFKLLVGARQVNPCQGALKQIKCRKSESKSSE